MAEAFVEILVVGGKSNSLGRVNEVIEAVLKDKSRLGELYTCLFEDDAWVRMRAADALEKVCRVHPDWFMPFVDRFADELAASTQPSVQWHLVQMYQQLELTDKQKEFAINWIKKLLSTTDVDWIVANNAMAALLQFVEDGSVSESEAVSLFKLQRRHKSKAVVKRADKFLLQLSAS